MTNLSTDRRVGELVLRWPTELDERSSSPRSRRRSSAIADGGPPLVQDWTKWVDGPGERGEPAGTTSLGWGPLAARRRADHPGPGHPASQGGAVAFDLQILAGEAILSLEERRPAELRVTVP